MKQVFRSLAGVIGLFVATASLLVGASADAQSSDAAYRIRPGDRLFISVWKEEGLAQAAIVRPDGGFTFPLAGELNARDKTVAAVAEEIRARIIRFIPEALVSVDVAELRGARVYIIGQVQMPGEFTMLSALDVIQALSMAGGLTAFASPGDIRILRRNAQGQTAIPFNYNSVIRGRDLEENIPLQDGDVIIVP